MRTRPLLSLALLGLAALLVLPAGAMAAKAPKIKSVSPKKLQVGDTLTIRGSGFKPGKGKNTVVFRADGLHLRVKAFSASRTRLKVEVPTKLQAYMKRRGSRALTTRFQISVVPRKGKASRYTSRSRSPLIQPAEAGSEGGSGGGTGSGSPQRSNAPAAAAAITDCNLDGVDDSLTADDDGDLLPDTQELGFLYKTDPCRADSDADGVEDGYEYQSARDLNDPAGSLPYPGKRPYPNPLFADSSIDFDGDSLRLAEEYSAWIRFSADGVLRVGRPTTLSSLVYSDGTQTSRVVSNAGAPTWIDFNDIPAGQLSDDERDVDSDGLPNYDESHGRLLYAYWKGAYESEKEYNLRPFGQLDFLDSDSDGDSVLDGADDQDNDDFRNDQEIERNYKLIDPNYYMMVNPYNPCMPDPGSRTCTRHPPLPLSTAPAPFSSIDARFQSGSAWDLSGDIAGPFPAPYSWP